MYYISLRFAWISVALLIFTALKYIARRSGKHSINCFFRTYHIGVGILMLITGFLHGIFAGNDRTTSSEHIKIASEFFSLNLGTVCFIVMLLLYLTYLLRKKLKRRWIVYHRGLTILLILLTILHIFSEL